MNKSPRGPRTWLIAAGLSLALLAGACGGDQATPQPTEGASVETIVTDDGVRLDARLFDVTGERLVILLHMYAADQSSWYDFARELQAAGYVSAMTLDFRGYGASGGSKDVGEIVRDVRAAVDFARERGYEAIVLVGASMGGTAAIIAAADDPVAGVIALSAPVEFRGLDAREAASRMRPPVVLFAARGDTSAAQSLDTFKERAAVPVGRAFLHDGAAHGTDMLEDKAGDTVRLNLIQMLNELFPG